MKKIWVVFVAVAALSVVGSGFAEDSGMRFSKIYTGLQLGYANLNYTNSFFESKLLNTSVHGTDTTGFAGRAYVGVQPSDYFGFELGYLYLPKVDAKVTYQSTSGLKLHFDQDVWDLMLKGMYPIRDKYEVYAKAGLAHAHREKLEAKGSGTSVTYADDDKSQFMPVASIGAAYHFNRHVFADVSYMHYFKRGDLQRISFYAIGAGYIF